MKILTPGQTRSGLLAFLVLSLFAVTRATPTSTFGPGGCTWTADPVLPIPILNEAVTSLNGSVYTFGGSGSGSAMAAAYKFDGTTWTAIAPLPIALNAPTAVNDGSIIYILGGSNSSGTAVNTLYKYDPVANNYATLAPFVTATSFPSVVYVAGNIYKFCGSVFQDFPTTALEIYNVATNTWTFGANYPMPVSYVSGFAQGNLVYGAGGRNPGSGATHKTYRFDPTTGIWDDAAIADLPALRFAAAAASYNGGAVVAGGAVGGGPHSNSVIFWDPPSNTWSNLPNLLAARAYMSGAAVNGSFYVVGGQSNDPPSDGTNNNQKLTCPLAPTPTPTPPGTPTPTPTPTPGICAWSAGPVLPIQIFDEAVTSLNGNLYSFGGRSSNSVIANSYRFDGTAWTAGAPLPQALTGTTAVNDGTNIYLPGGAGPTVNSNGLYRYNPVANTYTTLAPLLSPTAHHGTAYLGGKIYKLCGSVLEDFPTNALEIYDIATNTWTTGASYPLSLNYISVFVHGNFIYAAGGFTFSSPGPTAKAFRYDPTTNTWDDAAIADLPANRYDAATASYNGGGVLAGGTVGGNNSASVIFWDPVSNTWSNLQNMLGARSKMNGAVLNGSFHVVGGRSVAFPNGSNDNQKLTCPLAPATPTPTPPASPTPTSTPTPSAAPAKALNISTRLRVETGSNVLIGGFIVTGNASKNVTARGIGPSLAQFGIPDVLADPTLELRAADGALISQNDDWQDDSGQASQLIALGLAPQDPKESGIVATLQPGASYSAILAGKNGGTGVGLVEIYDTNPAANSQLANISTRGFVQTGNNVMIGGFILGSGNTTKVALRGIGPSLAQFGLNPVLADPILELHDSNGALLISNDDWADDPFSASQLAFYNLAPQDPKESGIFASLPPGAFTAIVTGTNGGTGIGLVEIYNVP